MCQHYNFLLIKNKYGKLKKLYLKDSIKESVLGAGYIELDNGTFEQIENP